MIVAEGDFKTALDILESCDKLSSLGYTEEYQGYIDAASSKIYIEMFCDELAKNRNFFQDNRGKALREALSQGLTGDADPDHDLYLMWIEEQEERSTRRGKELRVEEALARRNKQEKITMNAKSEKKFEDIYDSVMIDSEGDFYAALYILKDDAKLHALGYTEEDKETIRNVYEVILEQQRWDDVAERVGFSGDDRVGDMVKALSQGVSIGVDFEKHLISSKVNNIEYNIKAASQGLSVGVDFCADEYLKRLFEAREDSARRGREFRLRKAQNRRNKS